MDRTLSQEDLKRLFPNASGDFIKSNADSVAAGSRPSNKEPTKRSTLVSLQGRDDKVSPSHRRRFKIIFTVRSRRPGDWDSYNIKELQDLLRYSGILADDSWDLLQGEVRSEKVHTKEEEGTLIEIYENHNPQSKES